MCGRITITVDTVEFILERFKAEVAPGFEEFRPRYNAAPSQRVPAIVAKDDGNRYLTNVFWGFVPPWGEKEEKPVFQANIRDDTIRRNRFFGDRLLHNRCVFVVDGFYEWKLPEGYEQLERGKKLPKGVRKTPYRIVLKNRDLFSIGGLWRTFKHQGVATLSAGIITTGPNALMSPIHNRMPVLLSDREVDTWLDPSVEDTELLANLLDPFPDDELEIYPVSDIVNNSRIDIPGCIEQAP